MRTRVGESVQTISRDDWNALLSDSNPFVRHEFLAALEESGCVSVDTGWLPCPILVEAEDGRLLGALPLYLKNNSHGEFVFDFAWASAYHQAGLEYYPKLVAAVPFTPATGPRLLVHPDAPDPDAVRDALITGAIAMVKANNASSLHVLFPPKLQADEFADKQLMLRRDCQFHWENQDYTNFDEFLATFTSVKRKKTRRERRRIAESGVRFEKLHGADMTPELWDALMPLYRTTFLRRGREPYLNRRFFEMVAETLPDNMVVIIGFVDTEIVATAICFRSDEVLYGRYWGANRFIDSLHFETCYYQGIEYCIDEKLQRFEPGTQGEHKISRGFVPRLTWSVHWLSQPQFAAAVDDYLQREGQHIDQYVDFAWDRVPYRQDDS